MGREGRGDKGKGRGERGRRGVVKAGKMEKHMCSEVGGANQLALVKPVQTGLDITDLSRP